MGHRRVEAGSQSDEVVVVGQHRREQGRVHGRDGEAAARLQEQEVLVGPEDGSEQQTPAHVGEHLDVVEAGRMSQQDPMAPQGEQLRRQADERWEEPEGWGDHEHRGEGGPPDGPDASPAEDDARDQRLGKGDVEDTETAVGTQRLSRPVHGQLDGGGEEDHHRQALHEGRRPYLAEPIHDHLVSTGGDEGGDRLEEGEADGLGQPRHGH